MMDRNVVAVSLLGACLAFGCGENDPPAAAPPSAAGTIAPRTPTHAAVAAAPARPAPTVNSIVAPPRDARYTLFCQDIEGAGHAEMANQLKTQWAQATGRNDWYVIHRESSSILYFGYYKSFKDPAEGKANARAQADRQFVMSLKNSIGDQPFMQAMFVPLDAPDPSAPPEWNLTNAAGAWSVEIASFTGQDRKMLAVEAVRGARAAGENAYYFHGPSASSVCIGAWPDDAVQRPDWQKNAQHAVGNKNSDEGIVVVPGAASPALGDEVIDKEGNRMKVVRDGLIVQNPTMIAVLNRYPVHATNAAEDKDKPSAIVPIPHKDEVQPLANDRPAVDLLGGTRAAPNSSQGGGKLRSLGQ